MGHIVAFSDDCGGDPANASHWEHLVYVVEIVDWNLLQRGCGTIENNVVIVYFDCVRLRIRFFVG